MAKQLLWGGGFLVWNETVGKPLHIEPGTTTTTTTGTFTPTVICPGSSPSMVLTVEGASGTIGWCGKVWNLPGDSGLKQEVCPNGYFLGTGTLGGPYYGIENWLKSTGSNDGLLLKNRVVFDGTSIFEQYKGVAWADQGVGFLAISPASQNSAYADFRYWLGGSNSYLNLGVLNATSPMPIITNYRLSDGMFGSYTYNTITYTWARGTNW